MLEKDPMCGKEVEKEKAIVMLKLGERRIYFCSEKCANIYMKMRLGL